MWFLWLKLFLDIKSKNQAMNSSISMKGIPAVKNV